MERLYGIKITVQVDTSKGTYEADFETIEEAKAFLEEVLEDVY